MLFVFLFGYVISIPILIAAMCRTVSTVLFVAQFITYIMLKPWIKLSGFLDTIVKLAIFVLLPVLPLAETFIITLGTKSEVLHLYQFVNLLVSMTQALAYLEANFKEKVIFMLAVVVSYTPVIVVVRLPYILIFYLVCCAILIVFEIPDTSETRKYLCNYITEETSRFYNTKKNLFENIHPRVIAKNDSINA